MLQTRAKNVAPDFVGDHRHVIFAEQLHGLRNLPLLPDPATGVVGGAENGGVNLIFSDFFGSVRTDFLFFVLSVRILYNSGVAALRKALRVVKLTTRICPLLSSYMFISYSNKVYVKISF